MCPVERDDMVPEIGGQLSADALVSLDEITEVLATATEARGGFA